MAIKVRSNLRAGLLSLGVTIATIMWQSPDTSVVQVANAVRLGSLMRSPPMSRPFTWLDVENALAQSHDAFVAQEAQRAYFRGDIELGDTILKSTTEHNKALELDEEEDLARAIELSIFDENERKRQAEEAEVEAKELWEAIALSMKPSDRRDVALVNELPEDIKTHEVREIIEESPEGHNVGDENSEVSWRSGLGAGDVVLIGLGAELAREVDWRLKSSNNGTSSRTTEADASQGQATSLGLVSATSNEAPSADGHGPTYEVGMSVATQGTDSEETNAMPATTPEVVVNLPRTAEETTVSSLGSLDEISSTSTALAAPAPAQAGHYSPIYEGAETPMLADVYVTLFQTHDQTGWYVSEEMMKLLQATGMIKMLVMDGSFQGYAGNNDSLLPLTAGDSRSIELETESDAGHIGELTAQSGAKADFLRQISAKEFFKMLIDSGAMIQNVKFPEQFHLSSLAAAEIADAFPSVRESVQSLKLLPSAQEVKIELMSHAVPHALSKGKGGAVQVPTLSAHSHSPSSSSLSLDGNVITNAPGISTPPADVFTQILRRLAAEDQTAPRLTETSQSGSSAVAVSAHTPTGLFQQSNFGQPQLLGVTEVAAQTPNHTMAAGPTSFDGVSSGGAPTLTINGANVQPHKYLSQKQWTVYEGEPTFPSGWRATSSWKGPVLGGDSSSWGGARATTGAFKSWGAVPETTRHALPTALQPSQYKIGLQRWSWLAPTPAAYPVPKQVWAPTGPVQNAAKLDGEGDDLVFRVDKLEGEDDGQIDEVPDWLSDPNMGRSFTYEELKNVTEPINNSGIGGLLGSWIPWPTSWGIDARRGGLTWLLASAAQSLTNGTIQGLSHTVGRLSSPK